MYIMVQPAPEMEWPRESILQSRQALTSVSCLTFPSIFTRVVNRISIFGQCWSVFLQYYQTDTGEKLSQYFWDWNIWRNIWREHPFFLKRPFLRDPAPLFGKRDSRQILRTAKVSSAPNTDQNTDRQVPVTYQYWPHCQCQNGIQH